MNLLPHPANSDDPSQLAWGASPKILEWLSRLAQPGLSFETLGKPLDRQAKTSVEHGSGSPLFDDWQTISNLCGHNINDFINAGASLPLTAAEIDHFRRNHRGTESHVSRDFFTAKSDLPSPLAELYGLYLHRARTDAEATLFVAQATGSTRVARVMADLLAIGGFANGLEFITYLGITYSVPAAFDTSDIIDRANHEAARRLAMPVSHPAHLLKLTPDEIGVLASNIAEKHAMEPADFLEKANLLAEARQDVTRLPVNQHFTTAIIERDLPINQMWVARLCAAYARILETWVAGLPEVDAVMQ
ncbi:MAG TPA: hypothetical protein VFR09_07185 [Alphaproteobacteria bacterium]|nr:hypothetical protein [Alphaproteobacteria bacterium]